MIIIDWEPNIMNKVSEIEFHIKREEVDDCIIRMANLILEGYSVAEFYYNPKIYDTLTTKEPYMHIKLRRKFDNE
jgi:hypothetical protein